MRPKPSGGTRTITNALRAIEQRRGAFSQRLDKAREVGRGRSLSSTAPVGAPVEGSPDKEQK
jgi:hypothetical protein